jgi:hypothetical protein
MSQFVETNLKGLPAGGALGQYLRVTGATALSAAGASTVELGTLENATFAAGDLGQVRLRTANGTAKMVALTAITAGNAVYAAAGGKIAATGTVFVGTALEAAGADNDVIEVLRGPNTDISAAFPGSGAVKHVRTRFTIAQVNAGATLVAAKTGVKFRAVNGSMIAIGGAAAAHTTIDIIGTLSSARKLFAFAVANTAENALMQPGITGTAILAGGASYTANDANTAITVGVTGSPITTATHIDFLFSYVEEV